MSREQTDTCRHVSCEHSRYFRRQSLASRQTYCIKRLSLRDQSPGCSQPPLLFAQGPPSSACVKRGLGCSCAALSLRLHRAVSHEPCCTQLPATGVCFCCQVRWLRIMTFQVFGRTCTRSSRLIAATCRYGSAGSTKLQLLCRQS